MFILTKTNPILQDLFNFEPYHYGPYSQVLQDLAEEPFYFEEAYNFDDKGRIYITEEGKDEFNEILEENKGNKDFEELINALKLIRDFYDRLTVDELLLLIYVTYPDFTEYSSVSNRLLKNRKKRKFLSESLLKKGLITRKRYEELLGYEEQRQ